MGTNDSPKLNAGLRGRIWSRITLGSGSAKPASEGPTSPGPGSAEPASAAPTSPDAGLAGPASAAPTSPGFGSPSAASEGPTSPGSGSPAPASSGSTSPGLAPGQEGYEFSTGRNIRARIFEIVELGKEGDTFSKVYDHIMMISIFLSLIPLFFRTSNPFFILIDQVTVALFALDYILRWVTADINIKRGWKSFLLYPVTLVAIIDLIAIVPSVSLFYEEIKALRLFRLIRSLKVFKIFRYSKNIYTLIDIILDQAEALLAAGALAVAYVLISALIIFNVEPSAFDTFFDAVYWAVISLTTVGYGDIYPVTQIGRVFSMISAVFGIAILSLPAGIITAGYLQELRKPEDEKQKREELRGMRKADRNLAWAKWRREKLERRAMEAWREAAKAQEAADQAQRVAREAQKAAEQAQQEEKIQSSVAEEVLKAVEESKKAIENTQRDIEETQKKAIETHKPLEETQKDVEEAQKDIEKMQKDVEEMQKTAEKSFQAAEKFRRTAHKLRKTVRESQKTAEESQKAAAQAQHEAQEAQRAVDED